MKPINIFKKLIVSSILLLGLSTALQGQTVLETLEIQADEAKQVQAGTQIKHLIVNANINSVGQLLVPTGVVNVEKLTLKYAFVKGDWNFVSFPSDLLNLNDPTQTNLSTLGFQQALLGQRIYQIREFDSAVKSEELDNVSPWIRLSTPTMYAGKGYLIQIAGTVASDVETIEFYFNNLELKPDVALDRAVIDMDLTGKPSLQTYEVNISGANVKSNTLNVKILNDQQHVPAPINYEAAVVDAKFLFTENNEAFRLVLPDDSECKILIMDKRMKRVVKALSYTAPAEIPISLFKKGTYKALIEYGNATAIKELKIR